MSGTKPDKKARPARQRGKQPLPDDTGASAPTALTKLLDICRHVEAHPTQAHSLNSLSRRAGLSPFHLHRLFKAFMQVTPRKYVEQVRVAALKRQLRSDASVTEAIYAAGFESSSVVYGRLNVHLGMTPLAYRRGGQGVDISFAFGHTVLGKVLIGATDRGICYLQFGDSEAELLAQLVAEYPHATVTPSTATASGQYTAQFTAWMHALNASLAGNQSTTMSTNMLPLDIQGTAFQKQVWEFLCTIPCGTVVSYTEVANGIGKPKAVRAAASACANNRIGVLIPCHRVIRGDGGLGGYRWGLPRKRTLLDLERRADAPATPGTSRRTRK